MVYMVEISTIIALWGFYYLITKIYKTKDLFTFIITLITIIMTSYMLSGEVIHTYDNGSKLIILPIYISYMLMLLFISLGILYTLKFIADYITK